MSEGADKRRDEAAPREPAEFTAVLEHLTGRSRDVVEWLSGDRIAVTTGPERGLRLTEIDKGEAPESTLAQFIREDDDYAIKVSEGWSVWINQRLVREAHLRDGDVIEFGETLPMMRYRRFEGHAPLRWTINEIAADTLAYCRYSRRPLGYRLTRAARDFGRRVAFQTTVLFRVTVLIAIAALVAFALSQNRNAKLLEERVAAEAARLESIATSLAKTREEALHPADLNALRSEMDERVVSNLERLAALERRSAATTRIIREATSSVAFLQIAFGLREKASGKMMRYIMLAEGVPLMTPRGQPRLSLEGDGPVAEFQVTGTGFLLEAGDVMVTNRHVALPWESNSGGPGPVDDAFEPFVIRSIAYFPGRETAVPYRLLQASEDADLALIQLDAAPEGIAGLRVSEAPAEPGVEVLVLGYPTGLRSLLAQSGEAFVKRLQEEADTNFWSVAERLAVGGFIFPLASRGILAQATNDALVYDAETTSGGSGGPVLNPEGEVIAVNSAILPEFGGSNIGVPAAKLRALIAGLKSE